MPRRTVTQKAQSASQREYSEAEAAYSKILIALEPRIQALPEPAENEENEEVWLTYHEAIEAIREELGAQAAFDRVWAAETSLIAWGKAQAQKLPAQYRANQELLDGLFEQAASNLAVRKRLIAVIRLRLLETLSIDGREERSVPCWRGDGRPS